MKSFLAGAVIALSALAATPASAGVTLTGPANNQTATTSGASGGSFTIFFDGFGGDNPIVIDGLRSSITFDFVSGGGTNQYVFNYTVNNDSGAPITASRVSGFAFDVTPDVAKIGNKNNAQPNVTSTGLFNHVGTGNYPVGFGNVELCFNTGTGSCAGGGNGGVVMGQTMNNTGTITMTFAQAHDSISLLNFVDRYQAIRGASNGTGSAIGRQVGSVPEPGTWAMMLLGFGAIGFGLRRRPSDRLLQLA